MFGSYDPRWGDDPRDADGVEPRDRDEERAPTPADGRQGEPDDLQEREIDRDHHRDARNSDAPDPRDVLLADLDLPRGAEREVVWDHERAYELNGEDSRNLATVGAFRVVPEGDLRDPRDELLDPRQDSLDHLREIGRAHV